MTQFGVQSDLCSLIRGFRRTWAGKLDQKIHFDCSKWSTILLYWLLTIRFFMFPLNNKNSQLTYCDTETVLLVLFDSVPVSPCSLFCNYVFHGVVLSAICSFAPFESIFLRFHLGNTIIYFPSLLGYYHFWLLRLFMGPTTSEISFKKSDDNFQGMVGVIVHNFLICLTQLKFGQIPRTTRRPRL